MPVTRCPGRSWPRIRDGRAETITLHADPPFAAPTAGSYRVQEPPLSAGDQMVFLTDGMLERDARGVEVPSILAGGRHLHPRKAVQQPTRAVVHASDGRVRDDATVLCFGWHGGPPSRRDTSSGADI